MTGVYSEFPIRWYPDEAIPPPLEEDLRGVQANILHPHHRSAVVHLLLRVEDRQAARQSLAELSVTNAFVEAKRVSAEAANGNHHANQHVCLCFFTASGMEALGISDVVPAVHEAFRRGVSQRYRTDDWDHGFVEVDAMVSIAGPDPVAALDEADSMRGQLNGLTLIRQEDGGRLPGGREHFGHVDNISNPRFFAWDVLQNRPRHHSKPPEAWYEGRSPKIVLVEEDAHAFGSFFVFQKLKQDRNAFDQACSGRDPDIIRAKLIGRRRDGTVIWRDRRPGEQRYNDFNYEDGRHSHVLDGQVPHIQVVNRRKPDWPLIVRRGMPYGDGVNGGFGLLFGAYMAQIEDFETIEDAARAAGDPMIAAAGNEVVRLRGAAYFYAPSPPLLQSL